MNSKEIFKIYTNKESVFISIDQEVKRFLDFGDSKEKLVSLLQRDFKSIQSLQDLVLYSLKAQPELKDANIKTPQGTFGKFLEFKFDIDGILLYMPRLGEDTSECVAHMDMLVKRAYVKCQKEKLSNDKNVRSVIDCHLNTEAMMQIKLLSMGNKQDEEGEEND